MFLRLIGIVLVSVIGFAQAPALDTLGLWRMIRNSLVAPDGNDYFRQIKDSQIPPTHRRFSASVVSQPSPNEFIVNVDNPAGDATLWLPVAVKKSVAAGAPVHFEGVLRGYSGNPYRLTIEVLPEDIEGLY